MQNLSFLQHRTSSLTLAALLLVLNFIACQRDPRLPEKNSKEYRHTVTAFYTGLAALQVGDDVRAEEKLKQTTALAEGEPAGWANYGLLALRQREYDRASERLEKARTLAPEHADIYSLLALLESTRGKYAEAMTHLRRAIELNPKDLHALYSLAAEIEREGAANSAQEAAQLLEKILEAQPNNLAVQLDVARLAAKRGEAATLKNIVEKLSARATTWPPEVQAQVKALQEAAAGPNPRAAAPRVAFLRNVLLRVPEFRESLAAVKLPVDVLGAPLTRLILMESPSPDPAPLDANLTFQSVALAGLEGGEWQWSGAVSLTGEGAPVALVANGREVRLANGAKLGFPGGASATPPWPDGITPVDFDYDFKTDLVLAGAGGVRLFKQESDRALVDVTGRTTLPAAILNAAYTGVWAADVEADGDLDLMLGASEGAPLVLQNNGDGTFKELRLFAGVSALRGFAWADFDGDGDSDPALLDAQGRLNLYANERAGQFRARAVPSGLSPVVALNAGDVDNDGRLDLIALQANGIIARLSDQSEGTEWATAELGRWSAATPVALTIEHARIFAVDLDNNGALDLVASDATSARQWLSDAAHAFVPKDAAPSVRVLAVADLTGDGRLDFVGLSEHGQPALATNRGTKNYHWQMIRPRATSATGDQRINSFGVGGEMEIRAGLLVQKQLITQPLVHFGLGEQEQTDVVRIVWPNGSVQAEFELKADQAVLAEQRLKGSCPWVFAFDGQRMSFVTDFLWRSPLGLKINAQDTAGVAMTEEWIKLRSDQLAPREDGFYDIRITAELWETHFFDHVSLMVVDHPAPTDVFVDERFAIPPAKLEVYPTAAPRPVARAWDDRGSDVTDIVKARDGKYLDTFGRGNYQGVTRDHWVEIELPEDAPRGEASWWLIAEGWIHPTDSSINVAISQGSHAPPQSLSLEVPDGQGGWRVAKPGLGFPAGKLKTVLFDLAGVFPAGAPRRLRLRTNLEIYWDALGWASALPSTELRTQRIAPATAELRYRGFSVVHQADQSSPELPDYQRLAGTTQHWRDLIGYHTRFGDVRELLKVVDDRYVIMNAGDEMWLRFAAPPPPPAGWRRDFVLIGDGWEKDGDYNTTHSKTVLPLPTHTSNDYTKPPTRLEDDPVYRRFPQDWQDYHTRYVTPQSFHDALRMGRQKR